MRSNRPSRDQALPQFSPALAPVPDNRPVARAALPRPTGDGGLRGASRRARGRALPALLGLVAVLAVVALTVFGLRETAPEQAATGSAVQLEAAAVDPGTGLPPSDPGPTRPLQADPPTESTTVQAEQKPDPIQDVSAQVALVDYPRRDIPGRVILTDGATMPEHLRVHASQTRPKPAITHLSVNTLGSAMDLSGQRWSESASRDLIPRATLTKVDPDGHFVMHDFPLEGAWLDTNSDWYTQMDAQHYDGQAKELVLTLSRGAQVEGVVLTPSGDALPDAEVSGSTPIDPYMIFEGNSLLVQLDEVTTDARGRFRFAPVPTNVELLLSASEHGGSSQLASLSGDEETPPIDDDRTEHDGGQTDGPYQVTSVSLPALVAGQVFKTEIVLSPGSTIGGLVLDEQDQPVEQAGVHIQPARIDMTAIDPMGHITDDETSTDEQGHFSFTGLPDDTYILLLADARHRIVRSEPVDVAAGARVDDVLLRAETGLHVSGKVLDSEGQPVPGARVQVGSPPSFTSMRANAERALRPRVSVDEQGHFDLSGYEEGEVRIWATASGFVNTHTDVAAGSTDVVLHMQRETSVSGIAVSLADGEPLVDYRVRANPSGGLFDMAKILETDERMAARVAPRRVHDEEGRFELSGVAPGEYDLSVSAEGYARASVKKVTVEPGEGAHGLIFMVQPEARLQGTVVSTRTGEPLQGAQITTGKSDMMGIWDSMLDGGAATARSDAEGHFELRGLGSEPIRLTLSEAHHQPLTLERISLRPGESRDLGPIALSTGGSIWGQVSDEHGLPEAGVSVMVAESTGKSMKRASTDEQGMYRVEGLAAGSYNVMRMDFQMSSQADSAAGFLQDMVFKPTRLDPDEEQRVDLSKQEQGGTRLEGVVRSSAGVEAGATLWVVSEQGEASTRFAATDDQGHYAFAGLAPGHWLLQVLPSSSAMGTGSQPSSPVSRAVVVGGAATQRLDIDLPGGVLRGRVVAADGGQRLGGVRVVLERTDEGRPVSRFLAAMGGRVGEAFSTDQGVFEFRHLPGGTYAVVAGGQNIMGLGEPGWAARRKDDIGVSENGAGLSIELRLKAGGAISGTVRDERGQLLLNVPVWARNEDTGRWLGTLAEVTTDGAGLYTINSLEPGRWSLAFGGEHLALRIEQGITVSRDQVARRDVRLEPGIEVWIDCGSHDPFDLVPWVTGPEGRLPTQLVSMERLLGGRTEGNRLRVGRVSAGDYDVSVVSGSEVVFQDKLHLGSREHEITLEIEDSGGG